ncbi:outer membrane transport energization protein ExbB [Ferrimonas balearica DSM 9799]|uniref:Outer membrane transport energization protein ExbB n=1 Tax=Ferrimonas balearica (strain DSM 9799 / CCM 4581 / KCTC 23876 / PAT) TaxID=550540 RepID=E1SNE2_FERBD|nr:MotA/TolQ/ExbB proton channel family protein [Ferrimonas balearica]MBY6017065.1 MotA/TolQ/ExbB proton channel family protein [Halomonas denitrificans]ADN75626.1 outer membrane transport energization protein ExbB [Ferrimonas balearica DSM 9799]MBW3138524.1 MotA/TolQ/ExbB proton channel family protein [Ferrimonas balearica]MBW3163883.1 MotA/TolQ/ExbB proton channel family protein [Ferrimonas balearica]MBY5979294.1 MotA/TolQ/ExbB proton channel family protein [Ferrimonas balearica]
MTQWWDWIGQFMARGGPLLWVLAAVVLMIWVLMMERVLFLALRFPAQSAQWQAQWQARSERTSWYAVACREGMLGRAERGLNANLDFIKALVAICPMLGLLGTVTGMISVFDVMAAQGTGNPKLMSAGIAMATLPTMAGMVAALAGLFVHARLQKYSQRALHGLANALPREN